MRLYGPVKLIYQQTSVFVSTKDCQDWRGIYGCFNFIGTNFYSIMMTLSNGNVLCITGPLSGEFTNDRWIPLTKPVTRSFDVSCFLWYAPSKQLSKHSQSWWFETPSRSLWRHCNIYIYIPIFGSQDESPLAYLLTVCTIITKNTVFN